MTRKIDIWTRLCGLMIVALLLSSCMSEEGGPVVQSALKIYVFTPDRPIVTRADEGNVLSTGTEGNVNTMQIWVFKHSDGTLVGYLAPTADELVGLNGSQQATYLMRIPDWFYQAKPNVDVYVVANTTASNCGLTLDKNTTRAQLDAALIAHSTTDYFGITANTTSVPTDGLPMSGVLKNQKVEGEAPVLRVGDGGLASVKLVRAVSKIRFVASQNAAAEKKLKIKSITLDANVMPTQEYLFLTGAYTERSYHVGSTLEPATELWSDATLVIKECEDAATYTFITGTAQEYETQINQGITNNEVSELASYYWRESDKKLTGTITYQLGTDAEKTATFEMSEAGDFSRNHTWIVYAYHTGADQLKLISVFVTPWNTQAVVEPEVYNW